MAHITTDRAGGPHDSRVRRDELAGTVSARRADVQKYLTETRSSISLVNDQSYLQCDCCGYHGRASSWRSGIHRYGSSWPLLV